MSPVIFLRVPIPAPDFAGAGKRYRFRSKTAEGSGGRQIADCYKKETRSTKARYITRQQIIQSTDVSWTLFYKEKLTLNIEMILDRRNMNLLKFYSSIT
ncbi:hypothetical protein MC77_020045 [Citrobacter koseri]|nr:hypothetical protein MC77_020045 [Citrobacter koseri]